MQDLVYRLVNRFALGVFAALGLRFQVTGVENLPARGGAVLASNHVSYLDFTFVGLAARQRGRLVRFMAKKAVFDSRISGPLMRGMKHIPVDREAGASSFTEAVTALISGELIGIFPEATISRSWELKTFKSGSARLAMQAQVPLIPVVVWGGQRIYTVDKRWSLRRGRAIMVRVGEPITVTADAKAPVLQRELRARMRVMLDEVRADYPQQPDGPEDRWWLPKTMGGTAPTVEEAEVLEAAVLERRRAKRAARDAA